MNPTSNATAELQRKSRDVNSKCVHFMVLTPIEVIGTNMRSGQVSRDLKHDRGRPKSCLSTESSDKVMLVFF